MDLAEFYKSIKHLDFEDIIKKESREHLNNWEKHVSLRDVNDDKKFITDGLKRFTNHSDKILFLVEAINYLNEHLGQISGRIDYKVIENYDSDNFSIDNLFEYQRSKELYTKKKKYDTRIFFAVRELENLGITDLDENAFSNTQVDELTRRINALLIKIDELTVGQEVIFNFVDELKSDLKEMKGEFPLGKKRWYQRFSGIVTSYLGHKGADTLYDLIKPDIMKIIKDIPVDKLLH